MMLTIQKDRCTLMFIAALYMEANVHLWWTHKEMCTFMQWNITSAVEESLEVTASWTVDSLGHVTANGMRMRKERD